MMSRRGPGLIPEPARVPVGRPRGSLSGVLASEGAATPAGAGAYRTARTPDGSGRHRISAVQRGVSAARAICCCVSFTALSARFPGVTSRAVHRTAP